MEKAGKQGEEGTESFDWNEKSYGTVGSSKSDRPAYDFLYGYPTTSLMSLNLLANTSEVHRVSWNTWLSYSARARCIRVCWRIWHSCSEPGWWD